MCERGRPPPVLQVTTLRSEPFSANLHLVDCGEEALLVDAGTGADMAFVEAQLRKATDPAPVRRLSAGTTWRRSRAGAASAWSRAP